VRLILTSRPEDRVLVEFEPLEPYSLEELSEPNLNLSDIRYYVERRVEEPTLQDRLKEAEVMPCTIIDEVTRLSNGNFLYIWLLLDEIETGRQALDDLSTLPKSIDDVYLAFLRRFKPQEWKKQYQPILGILAVTQEPVTEDELANFIGIEPLELRRNLGILRRFLNVVENANGETYAIFHQSFQDYLLDRKRSKRFWCDAKKANQRISNYYLSLIL
jgi:serine/threonine-protein kinase